MGRVSGEPHVRCDVRQDVARTVRNDQAATVWRCPRCGAEVGVYVEATEVWCSCGTRMRRDGEPPPAKRKREVVQSGV